MTFYEWKIVNQKKASATSIQFSSSSLLKMFPIAVVLFHWLEFVLGGAPSSASIMEGVCIRRQQQQQQQQKKTSLQNSSSNRNGNKIKAVWPIQCPAPTYLTSRAKQ